MARDLSREELHALVWSRPMRTAAKERGISDVALAKQCSKANVPVPPRGYWNKVHAGKAIAALPLPALPIGARGGSRLDGIFPALEAGTGEYSSTEGLPEPPAFHDLDDVAVRIRAAVGEVEVAGRLANPHPIVAKLLGQDEARHGTASSGSLSYELAGPRFTTPIQQRRLRALSALLLALERVGCKASGSTHAGERFTVSAGGRHVYILLAVENGRFGDPLPPRGRGEAAGRGAVAPRRHGPHA